MLGYYLFDVSINNPLEESRYLINWNNKLSISDVDMHMMKDNNDHEEEKAHTHDKKDTDQAGMWR